MNRTTLRLTLATLLLTLGGALAGGPQKDITIQGSSSVASGATLSFASGATLTLPSGITLNLFGTSVTNAASFRSAIGAGTSTFSGAFSALSGKPTTISGYGITDAFSPGDNVTFGGDNQFTGENTFQTTTTINGVLSAPGGIDMASTAITSLLDPSQAHDAVTKQWAENATNMALSTWAGSTNITTIGAISTGTTITTGARAALGIEQDNAGFEALTVNANVVHYGSQLFAVRSVEVGDIFTIAGNGAGNYEITASTELDMDGQEIVNLTDPSAPQSAATKAYVDAHAGGGGTPGLPTWTFTSGSMAAGKVKTDNASPASTGTIYLAYEPKNGGVSLGPWFASSGVHWSFILLTDSTGKTLVYTVTGNSDHGTYWEYDVTPQAADATSWSGDYQLSLAVNPTAFIVAITQTQVNTNSSTSGLADGDYPISSAGGSVHIKDGVITSWTPAP